MNQIRIALIGMGKCAQQFHLPAIAQSPAFKLVASASTDGVGVDGVPSFMDYREMLERLGGGIEAVAISTPPAVRTEIASACLQRGIAVMLEKPPVRNCAEGECLLDASVESGAVLFGAYHSRYHKALHAVREALRGSRIRGMNVQWHEDVNKWHPNQPWIWQEGGFGVFDPGINALSMITMVFPAELEVAQSELWVPTNACTPIAAKLLLRSDVADELMLVSLDWRAQDEIWRIDIETDNGKRVQIANGGHLVTIDDVAVPNSDDEYSWIYSDFASLLSAGVSYVDLRPLRLVEEAMLTSGKNGVQPV